MSDQMTSDESYAHTLSLYLYWARLRADLFEPYALSLDNAETNTQRQSVMRQALRETFNARFPPATGARAA